MKISTVNYSDTSIKQVDKIQTNLVTSKQTSTLTSSSYIISEMVDDNGQPTKQAYQTAVNKMNEFMEFSHKDSKFVFHDGLEKYYVEIIDSKTDKVVKEIPPKELLDAYYEMQKLIGKMFDSKA